MKTLISYAIKCALLFSLVFTISCSGQSSSSDLTSGHSSLTEGEKTDQLRELISTYADYGEFNGAVLVAEEGEIVYQQGLGLANMEWDIPNQTDTKFRIGSITKQFTAMAVVQLAAQNRVDLHAPISTYLPDYPKENADRITIHHLLTHTSGTPNNYESPYEKPIRPDNYAPEYLVGIFSGLPLEFTPGEKFAYSNAGYSVLGLIIETVTQNMSTAYAAGALYSTVEDLFLWDQALYTDQLLPEEYLKRVFAQHIPDPDYGGYYGYGWSSKDKPLGNSGDQLPTIGHDGVIDGFCAIYTRIPSTQSTVILLSNIRRAPLNAMTKGIMGILHDKPYDFPRKSLAYSLLDAIDQEGIIKGIDYFETVKEDSTYYLSEDEMNIVSYRLLQSDRAEAAADVLKLGIEAYPDALKNTFLISLRGFH